MRNIFDNFQLLVGYATAPFENIFQNFTIFLRNGYFYLFLEGITFLKNMNTKKQLINKDFLDVL